jgi:hypothetical protein
LGKGPVKSSAFVVPRNSFLLKMVTTAPDVLVEKSEDKETIKKTKNRSRDIVHSIACRWNGLLSQNSIFELIAIHETWNGIEPISTILNQNNGCLVGLLERDAK